MHVVLFFLKKKKKKNFSCQHGSLLTILLEKEARQQDTVERIRGYQSKIGLQLLWANHFNLLSLSFPLRDY